MHARMFLPTIASLLIALVAVPRLARGQELPPCANWIPGPIDDGVYPNGTNGNVEAILAFDTDGNGPLGDRLCDGRFSRYRTRSAQHPRA